MVTIFCYHRKLEQVKKNFSILFIATVFIVSCKDEQTIGAPSALQAVPFLAGSENIYSWSATWDSAGAVFFSATDSISIQITSVSENIGIYTNATLLEGHSLMNFGGTVKVWYLPNKDSLMEIAYAGAGRLPVVMPKGENRFSGYSELSLPYSIRKIMSMKSKATDSTLWREDPRVVYKFPLTVGEKWTSFRYPFHQTRTVEGYELVNVTAGNFLCAKIKTDIIWNLTPDTALTWYDYVSAEGLISRRIEWKNIIMTDENFNEVGYFNSTEQMELVSRK